MKTVNGKKIQMYEVPAAEIIQVCTTLYDTKGVYLRRIAAADERSDNGCFTIYYIFSNPTKDEFIVPYLRLKDTLEFPSLTDTIYEATFYEREISTFFGLVPLSHKSLQPIILHANWPKNQHPLRKDFKWNHRPKPAAAGEGMDYTFGVIEGEGIYEIPVGPIHAGIIEPGHFRFSVAGEEIVNLEPMLGYVHKGTEKLFEELPLAKKVKLSERVSGDSSFSHSLAFCQAVEALDAQLAAPARATYLRVVFAELERLSNHFNDFGFILSDTGFSFGGSNGTRLREMIMQLNESLTGHRFLRGVNTIGGVLVDISEEQAATIVTTLSAMETDFTEIVDICENAESVLNRLKLTGVLSKEIASDHGVVGVAARAAGLPIDIRQDHPYAAYDQLTFTKATHKDGDVYARYQIRIQEVYSSISLIKQALKKMPAGAICAKAGLQAPDLKSAYEFTFPANAHSISMVEGWRGDILYFVTTDKKGAISRVAVRDPSFLNWPAVPYAVMGNIVPDFPLVNKSFNLSYSGNDR